MGVLFVWAARDLESKTTLIRILAFGVVLGAVGRIMSMVQVGTPRLLFQIDVTVEILIPLIVVIWQARLARIAAQGGAGSAQDGALA